MMNLRRKFLMSLLSANISILDDLPAPRTSVVAHPDNTDHKMFKLVVLSAFLAAVVAEPAAVLAPIVYRTSVISPAKTTINHQASSVIHPSPIVQPAPITYAAPIAYAHLIKKRSAGFAYSSVIAPAAYIAKPLSYAAPLTTYTSITPLATTYSSPVYATAHLIKKRSTPLPRQTNYSAILPTIPAVASLVTSYHPAPVYSTNFVSTTPIVYTHLIKKRSAPLAITYAAPGSFSHQSRLDIRTSPVITSHIPYIHSAPITVASYF
ncbi:unnamed protein product [Danaus chrysippus]|uniref:(African queen) hypothetical protein n=1 Tax=Danaus chrysippus TaxID=151541 RepID=A0A8J2VZL3_9NEOP|nr:unnamed protein product [Danaus chrysippus]